MNADLKSKGTIIVLRGPENAGKTRTIKRVWKSICNEYADKIVYLEGGEPCTDDGEIKAMFAIHNLNIGIESSGDPGGRLIDSIDQFVANGCALIICAGRPKKETFYAVENQQGKYEISRYIKHPVPVYNYSQEKTKKKAMKQANKHDAREIIFEFKYLVELHQG